jgi:SAM-dependent methyltransferase
MCVEVLKSKTDIKLARRELTQRKLSFTSHWWRRIARNASRSRAIDVGDPVKSWDVLKTVHFIEKNVPRHASILDMGAFASELPCILHKLNYSNVVGVDLNPDIRKMPYGDSVRYEVTDFMNTPFANESFDVITAVSVIEHGFNSQALLRELSRLLRPGGYFVASFDYWPEKIKSDGIMIFGMDWTIFSAQEVRILIQEATEYGLMPAGQVDLNSAERAVSCGEREYTFAWLVLQKTAPACHGEVPGN